MDMRMSICKPLLSSFMTSSSSSKSLVAAWDELMHLKSNNTLKITFPSTDEHKWEILPTSNDTTEHPLVLVSISSQRSRPHIPAKTMALGPKLNNGTGQLRHSCSCLSRHGHRWDRYWLVFICVRTNFNRTNSSERTCAYYLSALPTYLLDVSIDSLSFFWRSSQNFCPIELLPNISVRSADLFVGVRRVMIIRRLLKNFSSFCLTELP